MIKLKILITIICLALCLVIVMFVKSLLSLSFIEMLTNCLGFCILLKILLRLMTEWYNNH